MTDDYATWSEAQTETTVSVDGHDLSMAYWERGTENGGPPVVFVHGVPTNSFLWRDVAPAISGSHHVIALDMVGYGNSTMAEGFDRSIRAQEQALSDLIETLGFERVSLVAHDIGGGVALRYAAHEPDRVEQLVVSNAVCYDSWPVEFISTMGLPDTAEMDDETFDERLEFVFGEGTYNEADPTFVTGMKTPWLREGGKRAMARAAVSTNTNHTTEIPYGAITADLCCLWGEDDVLQSIEYGDRLAEEVGGEVVALEDAYHWVTEDRPETYCEELAAFLAE
jgi:haloalkane dehalogenase